MKAMKSLNHFAFILAALGSTLAGRMTAQTFTLLHAFTNSPDGARSVGGLLLSSNELYGTAEGGGAFGDGIVFRINPDGTGLTNLYSFSARNVLTNNDGFAPGGVLALSGNTLFGITVVGGTGGNGTVFRINTDGTDFTNLHSFTTMATNINGIYTNGDGAQPNGGVIVLGNTLYGTASLGGVSGDGIVFAMNTDGTGFTNLHNFVGSDGSMPDGSLVASSNILYGTTGSGGGSIFSINTNGTGFKTLYGSITATGPVVYTVTGNILYGTAELGQYEGQWGSVFTLNLTNSVVTTLHSFSGPDGAEPYGVILAGNTLYGTTVEGYNTNTGTIFSINTDGTGFTTLYAFSTTSGAKSTNSDGASPLTQLVFSGNTLYGVAGYGGIDGLGTIYSLSLPIVPPQLTITSAGTNVLLSWPTNATGFTLEFATNLPPTVWNTNSTAPVIVNQQNVVTNSISAAQMFYRLSEPSP